MTIPNLTTESIGKAVPSPHVKPKSGTLIAPSMTAYAVGLLRNVRLNDGIVAYLCGIDATLEPFGGRFIIHGGRKEVLEGAPSDDLIVIGFPTMEAARSWYASPAYQALIGFRTQGAEGDVFLIQGVDEAHQATDILK
ncbi:DUF1330 domain-containing protein [Rhizobium sp. PvP099]|uniref:DUF1330 domain-containing protein n=1 Tax=unclassified Rhizobium TaxID=2613769 RepID=UPI0032AEAC38|nr:uncharacterized protein (DUF1330 family) [Rhizobium sp. PvP014]MBP2527901.1 uncharacterized protein (DUF1330 family) [Rhizobium sp. PvP099]